MGCLNFVHWYSFQVLKFVTREVGKKSLRNKLGPSKLNPHIYFTSIKFFFIYGQSRSSSTLQPSNIESRKEVWCQLQSPYFNIDNDTKQTGLGLSTKANERRPLWQVEFTKFRRLFKKINKLIFDSLNENNFYTCEIELYVTRKDGNKKLSKQKISGKK